MAGRRDAERTLDRHGEDTIFHAAARCARYWGVAGQPSPESEFAFAFKNNFDGHVFDGYLRVEDPTGDKVEFNGDSRASYDFADELRAFQWGLQGGVSWSAYKHLVVNANLAWGCNNIFESSFKTISFNMYPIYLNFGFGYVF